MLLSSSNYFEKGASFDILKARKGTFRGWDHQLLQEMYVVEVKDRSKMKDKWDIFEIVMPSTRYQASPSS